MSELTRRRLLAGTATAAVAAATLDLDSAGRAHAATPPASTQAPGFYRYKVGSIEVTVVTDGMREAPIGAVGIKNATKEDVDAALRAAYLPPDKFPFVFNPCVVNTGSKLVMIDTGMGPAVYKQSNGQGGQTHTNLAAAGIDRARIDVVIISHFHGDHINGLLDESGKPAFANAEVMVPAPEWAFWNDESKLTSDGLKNNGKNIRRVFGALGNKVTQYENDKELVPGITSMFTFGHTPGHSSHIISSGSDTVALQADVTNYPALFVRHPNWHGAFDVQPELAEQTRRKFYDRLAADRMRVQGFHFPFPSTGYIEKDGNGYRYVQGAWRPVI